MSRQGQDKVQPRSEQVHGNVKEIFRQGKSNVKDRSWYCVEARSMQGKAKQP